MGRALGRIIGALFCVLCFGCAGVQNQEAGDTQQATATSKTVYDVVARACLDAFSDIRFPISNNDLGSGIIVARPVLDGAESYSKLSIVLKRSAAGVTIQVSFVPASGTSRREGIVDSYLTALRKRLPDLEVAAIE